MNETEAYTLLNWPHTGKGNDGDQWVAFRCPTPGCPSEGVSRNREHDFGRCGRCGAEMQMVSAAATIAKTPDFGWYLAFWKIRRRESNPHRAKLRQILSLLRLPVPPLRAY